MVSGEGWATMAYSLWKLQDRGPLFVQPATEIYEGMILWEHLKWGELVVNATKNKQLTNVRASGTDEALRLTTPKIMTLEEAIDYIGND
jgi:GTP-binding protein